jgi:dethiobiotin synthetase
MLKEKNYLILGIGTDVGKTFFVEALCKKFSNVKVIKPVVSGSLDSDLHSDSAKILTALGRVINKDNLDEISPWRFKEAVSPHFAGDVNYEDLKKFCLEKINEAKEQNSFLFIEAAGGVMTPINNEKTFLDLARDLKITILLVSSNYLGSISHTLTAVEVLKKNDISLEKIILNENSPSSIEVKHIVNTIENFSKTEVVTMKKFFN